MLGGERIPIVGIPGSGWCLKVIGRENFSNVTGAEYGGGNRDETKRGQIFLETPSLQAI